MPTRLRLPVLWLCLFTTLGIAFAGFAAANTAIASDDEEPLHVTAVIRPPQGDSPGQLVVTMSIDKPWHTYSITQPQGGPFTTKIKINEQDRVKIGSFSAATKPEVHFDEDFKMNVEIHETKAMWTAPVSLPAGADWANLTISGSVSAQACKAGACLPPQQFLFQAKKP